MAKWLAAGTVALIALLALLWMQIREPAAAVSAAPKQDVAQAAPMSTPSDLAKAAEKARELKAQGGKIDPASDSFTYRFDERVSPSLLMNAAGCYTGGINRVHRNQNTKLTMKIQIKDGVFSVKDVKIAASSIGDKALNDCFVREVAKTTWTDEQLPDWEQDEELVISPERGMKKFTKENLAYEGDGPIGKLEDTGPVASSREEPLENQKSPYEHEKAARE
jgi:hypothetical protein